MRTRVGYTGGTLASPTYRRMGDHTEAIQVDFDPSKLSYAELLRSFWASCDADEPAWKRQYMSALWPANDAQLKVARESLAAEEQRRRKKLYVELEPLGTFTPAEDYHQKYYLRHEPALLEAFRARGYDDRAFRESRVAARLNGFAGHCGNAELLELELAKWGLPPMAEHVLRGMRSGRLP